MNFRAATRIDHPGQRRVAGYTLIELLVALAIVALLLSLAAPRYFQGLDTARETVLAQDLLRVRETIDRFHGDNGRYPDSLEELVERRYLRALPVDPIIESQTAWIVIAPEQADKGRVGDIRSAAPGSMRNGQPYSSL